ncbi:MAG: NADH-quinone oxidoreductase subunit N [Chromatocurvus sp.]
MSGAWVQALAPLLLLAVGITVLLLLVALRRSAERARRLATATLLAAAAAALGVLVTGPPAADITPLLVADAPALLLAALFCLGGAVTAMLAGSYLAGHAEQQDEFYLLLLLAVLGAAVLAYAVHAASLLLGLELLSVASYALIAYPAERRPPVEAAVKYLVLSGGATATLLFGFALLYAGSGALGFADLAAAGVPGLAPAVPVAGATLVLVGFAFKIAAAPFHLWVADVYEGAPAPVSGFLASVANAAMLFALLRLFLEADLFRFPALVQGTALLAVLSMLVGNWLALRQENIKRLLAYSSVAHAGYLLILFSAGAALSQRALALEAALFYLVAYVPTTLAAFALLTQQSATRGGEELLAVDDLAGLFWRQPLAAVLFLVALLSLAGIPLTAGFFAKFYLFAAAAPGGHWVLLAALVAGSALGIYYYLRLVLVMIRRPEGITLATADAEPPVAGVPSGLFLGLIAVILVLGIAPGALMGYFAGLLG